MSTFPMTLPPSTVYGRLGIDTGPGEAIPFATLGGQLTGTETTVNDANYALVAADRTIAYTALTAARTVTLLAASAYPAGTKIYFLDRSGNANATRTISLAPTGADTINGANSTLAAVNGPYAMYAAETDGISKWAVGIPLFASSSPTLTGNWTFTPTSGNAITITTPTGSAASSNGLVITNTTTGTPTPGSQQATNQVTLNDSSINATGSIAAWQVQYGATATGSQGNGIGLLGVATTLANTNTFYGIGVQGQGFAQHTATGPTGLGGAGQVAGGNFLGHLSAGATGYFSCFGVEINTSVIPTGGNAPKFKAGILIAQNIGDAARGATYDTALAVSSANATIKWKNALLMGDMAGLSGFATDSVLLATTGTQTVSKFIDFSSYTASSMIADFGATVLQIDGSGNIFLGASDAYAWASLSRITSPGNGVVLLSNNTVTDFTRLQLGGTTTSFPAIKRNAAAINFVLGDGTGNAAITAGATTLNGALTYGGVTLSNAVTGTGNMVLATTPTLTTPVIGAATGTSLTLTGNFSSTSYLSGLALKNEAGSQVTVIDSASGGRYLRFLNPDGVAVFQAGNTNDASMTISHTVVQFTNLVNNVNWGKFNTSGLTLQKGQLILTDAASFSANASVATVLGSVGPVGSHTTVQKWLTITDGSTTLYIPAF